MLKERNKEIVTHSRINKYDLLYEYKGSDVGEHFFVSPIDFFIVSCYSLFLVKPMGMSINIVTDYKTVVVINY